MVPDRLTTLMEEKGTLETQSEGQVFHAQNFPEALFMLKKGYVKRYQVGKDGVRVIELIYGPGHIFPLSQLYKKLFGVEQNQEELVYVYQAMTDVEIYRLDDDAIVAQLQERPELYEDLYYEAGLRLKSNIERLASNAIKNDYKKVAHQLVCLANEFGKTTEHDGKAVSVIGVPLEPVDMAEQLNISTEIADAVMSSLHNNKLIRIKGKTIEVPDLDLLKDAYLR
jgi:CRP-like cAMP-binding protein